MAIIGEPIELDIDARDAALCGLCPFCRRPIRNWRLPVEGLPPDLYAHIRDDWKIDPRTGHAMSCPRKEITLA